MNFKSIPLSMNMWEPMRLPEKVLSNSHAHALKMQLRIEPYFKPPEVLASLLWQGVLMSFGQDKFNHVTVALCFFFLNRDSGQSDRSQVRSLGVVPRGRHLTYTRRVHC